MPLASVNGIKLFYDSQGEGQAVVFAHGAGGNHLSWWQQVAVMAASYRCITFDHRGFGLSRDTTEAPGAASFIDDLRALLDYLGVERAALVGQSMGGFTALGFATRYPERTRALVLCDTTGGIDHPQVEQMMQEWNAGRRPPDAQLDWILSRALKPDLAQRNPMLYFLYRQISGINLHVPQQRRPSVLGRHHRVDPLIAWRIPVMLVVGEDDELVPPHAMEAMARAIPQARVYRVPGAGHSVYFEKAVEFNALLDEFLRSVMS